MLAASTGVLSERGFTGWGGARAGQAELLNELAWMAELETQGKAYYSINEVRTRGIFSSCQSVIFLNLNFVVVNGRTFRTHT